MAGPRQELRASVFSSLRLAAYQPSYWPRLLVSIHIHHLVHIWHRLQLLSLKQDHSDTITKTTFRSAVQAEQLLFQQR